MDARERRASHPQAARAGCRARAAPGRPGARAAARAAAIDSPRMLNHHRGLWGYTGPGRGRRAADDPEHRARGPSAAAVVAELVGLGARRLVRVGTAAGLGDTPLGAVVAVDAAIARRRREPRARAGERVEAGRGAHRGAGRRGRRAPGLVASGDVHDPARPRSGRAGARSRPTWRRRRCSPPPPGWRRRGGRVVAVTRAGGRRLDDAGLEAARAELGRRRRPRWRRAGDERSAARAERPASPPALARRRLAAPAAARPRGAPARAAPAPARRRGCGRGCADPRRACPAAPSIAASRSPGGWAVRDTSSGGGRGGRRRPRSPPGAGRPSAAGG